MIKNFIKERSKIHLLIVIASLILFFIGIIPEFLNYSIWFKDFTMSYYMIDSNLTAEQIHLALSTSDFLIFSDMHTILLTCFMVISIIFNITSYIYKKLELLSISISFILLIILLNLTNGIEGCIFFILVIILNILAYIEQLKINKTKIKN